MSLKLNKNLNIEELKKSFQENNFISINNFLEPESAEKIYNFLNTMNESWWANSTTIDSNKMEYSRN